MNETKIFEYVLQTVNEEKLTEMLAHHTLGGVTASDIEEHFHISRANASAYLNKLVTQKMLIKVDSRPVHFFPADLINLYVSDNPLQYTYTIDEFFKNVTTRQGKITPPPNFRCLSCTDRTRWQSSYPD